MTAGPELHALKRRVHLVLAIALAASVAANVLAAEPTVVARSVAAWPPIALLLVVDVLGRVPVASGWTGRVAAGSAGLVALVAGIASFSHVRHVALEVGESELVAWILPLSVDGLAVVCSVALVEINYRLQPTTPTAPVADASAADLTALLAASDALPAPSVESSASVNGSEPVAWL